MNIHFDLVQGQLESYNESNLERFCSFYHPEVKVKFLITDELFVSGIDDFRLKYLELFSKYPDQKCVLKNRTIHSDCIIDEEHILGRPDYPEGLQATVIYAFRDQLIDRVWFI